MKFIQLVLRRPMSVIMLILGVVVFGTASLTQMPLEYMPDMEMPMELVMVTWPGADADSVDRLLTQPLEEECESLSDLDSINSYSSENYTMLQLTYKYGTDMDEAYSDLKSTIDNLMPSLPDDCQDPMIMEISADALGTMMISATAPEGIDVADYLDNDVVPALENIGGVAQVELAGAQDEYLRIVLDEAAMQQYGLSISTVGSAIAAADFDMPVGSVSLGSQDISLGVYGNVEINPSFRDLPIQTPSGQTVKLDDICTFFNLYEEEADTVSRYNGQESVMLTVTKQNSASTMEVCNAVQDVLDQYSVDGVSFEIIYSEGDSIMETMGEILNTLITGVILTMIVLFIFFGDLKASLIVGISMPLSILLAVILLNFAGYNIDLMTGSALIIAIGMIVDNSIVVIESCFRARDTHEDYKEAALRGTKAVTMSIIASTITTIVVYLPLATVDDLAGQMFGQLGFTIVFAMLASLISAMTLVPLFYSLFKPTEKKGIPANRIVDKTTRVYRKILRKVLHRKLVVVGVTLALVAVAGLMLTQVNMELMPASDEGIVEVSASFRPGTTLEDKESAMEKLEALAKAEPDVASYSVSIESGSSASLRAYLKSDRELSTADVIEKWNRETRDYTGMELDIASGGSSMGSGMMSSSTTEIDLQGADMEILKKAARKAQEAMEQVDGVIKVTSSAQDTSTAAKLEIDPLMSMHYGMTPVQVAGSIRNILSGTDVLTVTKDGTEYEVKLEYPEGLYDSMNSLMDATLTNNQGIQVPVREIAQVVYTDAPQTIMKVDGKYQISLTAATTQEARFTAQKTLLQTVGALTLPAGVEVAEDMVTEIMNEEFGVLYQSILIAVFLVFLVMAMQFESPRFSFMVMMCIPFSLVGSVFLLYIAGITISMVSLMGFLMLAGIVVNNGILYVDTVNQLRQEIPLEDALIDAGAIRLRPILMTTLTTILSMLPMGLGIGRNSEMMQGMALVIIGGLVASTLLTLLLMPTIYLIIDKKKPKRLQAENKTQ